MGNETERKAIDMNHFYDVQSGLKESMININKTLDDINNWEELINLKEESIEDIKIKKTKTIKSDYSSCKKKLSIFCGVVFCIIQLIGVQSSIIILNSLFNEIIEELKLWLNKTPREHNFYEILEKNSYRELPEIDVGMITSSVGIIALKNSGFICSNISFQLSSSIWFLLLFLLFDFHTGVQLLKNYTRLEIVILVLSYVFLSILVGCSSTIAIKEFTDKYYGVYDKNNANQEKGEKILFYFFSAISAFIIMPINRKIFTSFNDKTSKWILKWLIIICFISFGLSIVSYGLYLMPITTKKKFIKNKIKVKNNNNGKDKNSGTNKIENENEEVKNSKTSQNENEIEEIKISKIENEENSKTSKNENEIEEIKVSKIENEELKEVYSQNSKIENEEIKEEKSKSSKIENESEKIKNIRTSKIENDNEEIKEENSQTIRIESENEYIKSKPLDSEIEIVKFNQSFPQNKEKIDKIREKKFEKKNKKEIYSTKICTLCGYIYLRKKNAKKSACVCYYYTNKCTWFKEKIFNAEVIIPFFIELSLQICIMGFNPILTEKLLNDYSYSKNMKFYCALFIISLFFGIFLVYKCSENPKDINQKKDPKILDYINISFIPLFGFIIFTFISSVCYFTDNNLIRERWNNIIMTEFIYFKVLDFQILSFFDFLDNSDIFNTTLAITFEKLLWMIIETIIDAYVKNKKALVLVQIIVTSLIIGILFIPLIIIIIIALFYTD